MVMRYVLPPRSAASSGAYRRAEAARTPASYYKITYRRRSLFGRTFSRSTDWRRIATCYDRWARTFFSAIYIAKSS